MARLPPDNPDDWSEDEWLEWLAEVDSEAPPDTVNPRRRQRSAAASVLGAAMLGLHQAMYGEQQTDIVMVVESDGDPPDPQTVEVHLDPDDPDASTVMVRDENHREKET
jgi:hypothetical protein